MAEDKTLKMSFECHRGSWLLLVSVGFKQFLHFCVSGCLWLRKGILPVSDLLFFLPGTDWHYDQKNPELPTNPFLHAEIKAKVSGNTVFCSCWSWWDETQIFSWPFLTISFFHNLLFQLLSITKSFCFTSKRKSWCPGTRTIPSCCTAFPRAQAVWDWIKPSLGRADCALAIFYLTEII